MNVKLQKLPTSLTSYSSVWYWVKSFGQRQKSWLGVHSLLLRNVYTVVSIVKMLLYKNEAWISICVQSVVCSRWTWCVQERYRNEAQAARTDSRQAVIGLGIALACALLYAVVMSLVASRDCIRHKIRSNLLSRQPTYNARLTGTVQLAAYGQWWWNCKKEVGERSPFLSFPPSPSPFPLPHSAAKRPLKTS